MEDFYESVYAHDYPRGKAHGWIQWKGTDVCIDLYCACGYQGHYDGDFLYFYACPACDAKYAVGQNVKLIPLTAKQIDHIKTKTLGFKTSDDEEEVDNEITL